LGQKQTYAVHQPVSALPPKADMCGAARDVRFGPLMQCSEKDRYSIKLAASREQADISWNHLDRPT
jgi:hypothetical protein